MEPRSSGRRGRCGESRAPLEQHPFPALQLLCRGPVAEPAVAGASLQPCWAAAPGASGGALQTQGPYCLSSHLPRTPASSARGRPRLCLSAPGFGLLLSFSVTLTVLQLNNIPWYAIRHREEFSIIFGPHCSLAIKVSKNFVTCNSRKLKLR